MKRSGFLSRYTTLRPVNPERQAQRTARTGSSLPKRTAPLRKYGPTKAKKVARQKAFYSSAVWKRLRKEALERAGHMCQYQESGPPSCVTGNDMMGMFETWRNTLVIHLCQEREGLQVHHRSNARFGGKEQPGDLIVLCKAHHGFVERRDYPHRHPKRSVA